MQCMFLHMHVPSRKYRMVVEVLSICRQCQGTFEPTVLEVEGREGESDEERDRESEREKEREREKETN